MKPVSKDDIKKVLASFDRTTDHFLSREEFEARLMSGQPLRIKYGVDVKTSTMHIGHAVNLWLIRALQDLGHKVVIVFADFTSRIGDLDGRIDTISDIPEKEVEKNIADILRQAGMILKLDDPNLCEIHRNSEWYGRMGVQEIMNLLSIVTHARLISRDTFQMRVAEEREIYMNEMLYPVLQGYDSYRVAADLCITASDQLFSESMGRFLQEKHRRKPQVVITTVMTPGIDGKTKQSQRRNNDISLSHSPRDKFGRVMSIPDTLIEEYFRIYTELDLGDFAELRRLISENPRDAKAKLAETIVARYHGPEAARAEAEWFDITISKGYIPSDLPTLAIPVRHMEVMDLVTLTRPMKSKSDTRRLISQGGVELNGRQLRQPKQEIYLKDGDVLQVGRRAWFEIKVAHPPAFETERLVARALQVSDIPAVSKYVPKADLLKYIVRFGKKKKGDGDIADAFKKIIFNGEARSEWLWLLGDKANPSNIIGVAHLRGDQPGSPQNVWIAPGLNDEETLINEIMTDLSEYTLSRLDPRGDAFKNSFALVTAPRTDDTLHQAYRLMEGALLARMDAPHGVQGFTHDGWDRLQQWRRVVTPWLFKNDALKPGIKAPEVKKKDPTPEP